VNVYIKDCFQELISNGARTPLSYGGHDSTRWFCVVRVAQLCDFLTVHYCLSFCTFYFFPSLIFFVWINNIFRFTEIFRIPSCSLEFHLILSAILCGRLFEGYEYNWNLTSIWLSCYTAIINSMFMLLQLLHVLCCICGNMCTLLTILLYLRYGVIQTFVHVPKSNIHFVYSLLLSFFFFWSLRLTYLEIHFLFVYIVYWRPVLYNFMFVSTCIKTII
jgi:hypothetical protein